MEWICRLSRRNRILNRQLIEKLEYCIDQQQTSMASGLFRRHIRDGETLSTTKKKKAENFRRMNRDAGGWTLFIFRTSRGPTVFHFNLLCTRSIRVFNSSTSFVHSQSSLPCKLSHAIHLSLFDSVYNWFIHSMVVASILLFIPFTSAKSNCSRAKRGRSSDKLFISLLLFFFFIVCLSSFLFLLSEWA